MQLASVEKQDCAQKKKEHEGPLKVKDRHSHKRVRNTSERGDRVIGGFREREKNGGPITFKGDHYTKTCLPENPGPQGKGGGTTLGRKSHTSKSQDDRGHRKLELKVGRMFGGGEKSFSSERLPFEEKKGNPREFKPQLAGLKDFVDGACIGGGDK